MPDVIQGGSAAAMDWIEEIRTSLRLSPAGVILLVDRAIPAQLGPLVCALFLDWPGLEVLVGTSDLDGMPHGAVVVLIPTRKDATWLNLRRPLFARKALKVVLFCQEDTTIALAQRAPDFYDWIARRLDCPSGASERLV